MSKITKSISIIIVAILLIFVVFLTVMGKTITDSLLNSENPPDKGAGVVLSFLFQMPVTLFSMFFGVIGFISSLVKSFTNYKVGKIIFIIFTIVFLITIIFNIFQMSNVLTYLKT